MKTSSRVTQESLRGGGDRCFAIKGELVLWFVEGKVLGGMGQPHLDEEEQACVTIQLTGPTHQSSVSTRHFTPAQYITGPLLQTGFKSLGLKVYAKESGP